MISFIEACSQQQACPGILPGLGILVSGLLRYCLADFLLYWGWLRRRFLIVTDCGGDPVPCPLWGEERVMLDNELGSIIFQLYFLNVETIFIVSVDMIPCKCFSRNGIIY